jgi:formamidopyrimidine-DNA glycosylase
VPESPEVEGLARDLSQRLGGREVTGVDVASVSALKTWSPPIEALVGRTVNGVERMGKMVAIRTLGPPAGPEEQDGGAVSDPGPPLWLVVHLARGGWIRFRKELPPGRPRPGKGPLALRVRLAGGGGLEVTEAGTEKHLAIWLTERPEELAPVARLGPDPLEPGFDLEGLSSALAGSTATLKGVLTDQRVLAGVGNAYSDDVLHAARLSPFKTAGRLSPDELGRLHRALVEVLEDAAGRASGLSASELKGEKRAGMRVHGRSGEPCPVCGEPVRDVWFATSSLQYCPRCQTGGKVLADRRLSRLLK